eukprot:TRINITY_DN10809_c0_g1_i1.p1 TRINITY_DN10809_c0_g1~~TRINITY_DN10809_c0_g1_i1.p1  ORF type:complete len:358 (+),score=43.83 TRINITY_DN10809_c0_g1_i1:90-1076(+)
MAISMSILMKDILSVFPFPMFIFATNQLATLPVTILLERYLKRRGDKRDRDVDIEDPLSDSLMEEENGGGGEEVTFHEKTMMGCLFSLSVMLSIWSLKHNTFTNNQLYKILTLPVIAWGSVLYLKKSYNFYAVVSLVSVLFFAAVAIGIDHIDVSFVGLGLGTCSLFAATCQQLYFQKIGTKYNLNGFSIMSLITPYAAAISSIYSLFSVLTRIGDFREGIIVEGIPLKIFGTMIISILLNTTAFQMQSQGSALFFQLMGLLKTITLMGADGYLYNAQFSWIKTISMYFVMLSMLSYSYFREAVTNLRVLIIASICLFPLIMGVTSSH